MGNEIDFNGFAPGDPDRAGVRRNRFVMPQGMDGFLKTWGLLQFAAAVEDTLVRKLTVSDLVRYSDRGFQHG